MLAISISMKAEYGAQEMGNEAFGYYSGALMIMLILSIPTVVLWLVLIKLYQPYSGKIIKAIVEKL
jgi:hypothetical protein